ncbi:hypothetical protein [Aquabacterium humicola]|uniref:hypothetical protein n=1 Tax=Aquabacterium humicola TaxID=3237377 RepID=UPI0025427A71|nr:hypothetical protein [Rubrivivax pictus]
MPTVNRVDVSQSLRDASPGHRRQALALVTVLLIAAAMPALGEPWVQTADVPAGDAAVAAPATAAKPSMPDDDAAPATAQAIGVLLGAAPPAAATPVDGPLDELPLEGLQRLVLAEGQRLGAPVDPALFAPRPPSASDAPLLVDMAIDVLNQAPNRDLLKALAAPLPWPLLLGVLVAIAAGVLVAQRRRHAHRRRREYRHGHHHWRQHEHHAAPDQAHASEPPRGQPGHPGHRRSRRLRLRAPLTPGVQPPRI